MSAHPRKNPPPAKLTTLAWTLLLAALLLTPACSRENKAQRERPPVPVTVGQAKQQDVPEVIKAIGRVEALSTVSIKSRVTGQLMTVHFKEGQFVKKGDPLFTIDPAPFETALRQVQALAARDQAQAEKAAEDFRRYQELVSRKAVSAAQYEQFQTEARAKAAQAQMSQAEVNNARLNISFCHIASPIAGVMGSLQAYAGNMIKANDDKHMVTITQVQPILVSFAVPEQNLSRIRRFQTQGQLKVRAAPPGDDDLPVSGGLVFVDNTVDTATGTIRLKASYDNPDHLLWPGQFVNVTMLLTIRQGAVVVPSKALSVGQAGTYVFVVQPDQTVQVRQLKPGLSLDGLTVVEEGLKAGEQVVTDGQLRLMPGAKIVIKGQDEGGEAKS
ncbi:MAG: efflux RND transporter periplasmic adaptor subunit [Desulfarculus sp.]|nr:efflux RND transporter periplasmic adaptor subunit [Desulfarculus sp.]